MPEFEVPEILRTELSESLLFLASSGITDFQNFSWFEHPDRNNLHRANKLLKNLGALTEKNQITPLGKKMLSMPLPPRWAKAMVLAKDRNLESEIATMAAIMQERDILISSQDTNAECDLILRLEMVLQSPHRFPNITKVANQLTRSSFPKTLNIKEIKRLLLEVFIDQLNRRRKPKEFASIMITGQGLSLSEKNQVRDSEFFVALQILEGKATLACGIEKSWIEELCHKNIQEKSWVEFDEKSGKVLRKTAKSLTLAGIGSLPLENERVHPASQEDAAKYLPEIALQAKDEILQKNEDLKSWIERYSVYCKVFEISEITDEQWKEIFEEACYQEKSLNALFEKNLIPFVESKIEPSTIKSFHKEAPASIQVPTGNNIKIQYFC
jgi:ATP-dependent helicase HrpB